jgi:hypothetical protein
MLLVSNPCPVLLGRLLRLSRRVRNLVWRFLSGHADAEGVEWVNQLSRTMANLLDREKLPLTLPDRARIMDPVFVWPPVIMIDTVPLRLCRIAFTRVSNNDRRPYGGVIGTTTHTPDKSHPHRCHYVWNAYLTTEDDRYFDWYIVARAISIRFDKLILASNIELQTMARDDDRWSLESSLFII